MTELKKVHNREAPPRRLGILVGGSGLIGGTLMHYFKTKAGDAIDILAPNSKKMSLREPQDIKQYFSRYKPDFIINAAIAAIDSDPQLAFEVNYLGTVYLARIAAELGIPYIHISSAATLPPGENLSEDAHLPLTAALPNYAKSKLMAELTLKHLHKTSGLDYTNIRLAVVYGEHDHKIQGFHRLFFSIANESMPAMLTRPGVMHSYSSSKKFPYFVHHALNNRQEFGGQTFNFIDKEPVELVKLIRTIKAYLELKIPKEVYIPYQVAKWGVFFLEGLVKGLNRFGIEARMPAELLFFENFYKTQTLSPEKLLRSSFVDPRPEMTIFTELPNLIQYYLTRWEHLNLISRYNKEFFDPKKRAEEFLYSPETLLEAIHSGTIDNYNKKDICS